MTLKKMALSLWHNKKIKIMGFSNLPFDDRCISFNYLFMGPVKEHTFATFKHKLSAKENVRMPFISWLRLINNYNNILC